MEVKAEIQVLIDSIFTSWIHMPVQENVLVEECKKMGINLDNPNYKLECCSYKNEAKTHRQTYGMKESND